MEYAHHLIHIDCKIVKTRDTFFAKDKSLNCSGILHRKNILKICSQWKVHSKLKRSIIADNKQNKFIAFQE